MKISLPPHQSRAIYLIANGTPYGIAVQTMRALIRKKLVKRQKDGFARLTKRGSEAIVSNL